MILKPGFSFCTELSDRLMNETLILRCLPLKPGFNLFDMLFPELKEKRFGYVNMNEAAKAWFAKYPEPIVSENPLLDPATCQAMMNEVHAELGIDVSYGGWLEDRSTLWRGSYLDEAK